MPQPAICHRSVLLTIVLATHCPAVGGLFEWLRQTESPPAATSPPTARLPAAVAPPFEMTVIDEKFLDEAKQMELSPLENCHYRVVAQLKSTCQSLTEEQLAKLGVVLFNCQAEIEGRRTYPCTEEMTIKQCTADMDADTWNAYHIVSNRARSVCYATRQQHFRRRAELTVNSLISAATSQLDAMQDLKEGQLELKELTAASLEKLLQGHSALQAQQGELWEGQEQLEGSLRANLEQLSQEKALIASGQELIAQLIRGIVQKMENVSKQLKGQDSEMEDNHRAVIQDLADVRDRAQDIYSKIDHSMLGFLQYQDQTAQYYTDLMSKLERMNATLGFMFHYLDNMQNHIDERLHMIQGYLGWAGVSLTAMWTCIVHMGYFLLCAVLQTFLHCKFFSRVMLLLAVPLNAVAEVNKLPALDLTGLILLLFLLSLGHWFVNRLLRACIQIGGKSASLPTCRTVEPEKHCVPCPSSSTPQRDEFNDPIEREDLFNTNGFISGDPYLSAIIDGIPMKNLGVAFDSPSAIQSLVSNSSPAGRQLCNGITKTGKACKKRATLGQEYCRVHEGGCTSYVNT
ncbi:protein brambleberry [Lampris incognitus]|uniref:protein brambleberry n=1 Tax=Lampris incognitus TaxID=2546036 RepID=UPI0024B4FE1D|nr:protein brambleberry [Lampris incognitus]